MRQIQSLINHDIQHHAERKRLHINIYQVRKFVPVLVNQYPHEICVEHECNQTKQILDQRK